MIVIFLRLIVFFVFDGGGDGKKIFGVLGNVIINFFIFFSWKKL